jgi:hypothetical protein
MTTHSSLFFRSASDEGKRFVRFKQGAIDVGFNKGNHFWCDATKLFTIVIFSFP